MFTKTVMASKRRGARMRVDVTVEETRNAARHRQCRRANRKCL